MADARFLIVGDGPQRGELEALARSLSLSDAVRFLGTQSDVHEVLSLIDVLALTSHMEANPVSILEAMAAGKPVVATRVGSVDKAVDEGRSGYLVSPGSEEELAGRLIELLRDRAGRRLRPRRAAVRRRARFDRTDGGRLRGDAGGHLPAKAANGAEKRRLPARWTTLGWGNIRGKSLYNDTPG